MYICIISQIIFNYIDFSVITLLFPINAATSHILATVLVTPTFDSCPIVRLGSKAATVSITAANRRSWLRIRCGLVVLTQNRHYHVAEEATCVDVSFLQHDETFVSPHCSPRVANYPRFLGLPDGHHSVVQFCATLTSRHNTSAEQLPLLSVHSNGNWTSDQFTHKGSVLTFHHLLTRYVIEDYR